MASSSFLKYFDWPAKLQVTLYSGGVASPYDSDDIGDGSTVSDGFALQTDCQARMLLDVVVSFFGRGFCSLVFLGGGGECRR